MTTEATETQNTPEAEGTGDTSTSSSPEPITGSTILEPDQIAQLMAFDPFAENTSEQSSTDGGDAEAGDNSAPTTPEPVNGGAEGAAVAEGTTPQATSNDDLRGMVQSILQAQQEMQQRLPGASEVEGTQTQAQEDDGSSDVANYAVQVPMQVTEALASDDLGVRGQAMNMLVNTVMKTVHQNVRAEFKEALEAMQQNLPQTIQAQQTEIQRRQQVYNDFYGENKDLNNPALYPVVANVAKELMAKQPNLFANGFGPDARAKVAEATRALLGGVVNPAPAPIPAAKPPVINPATTARPAPERLSGQDKHLADLFG